MSFKVISVLVLCCYVCVSFGQQQGQPIQQGQHLSECLIARARAVKSKAAVNLIPNCEPNGDYSALQCHSNSRFCQCWKSDGTPVSQPSSRTRKCDCILHKSRVTNVGSPSNLGAAIGAYVPQCAPDGGYAKKQCHASTGHCWCVNDYGTQIGQKTRSTINCR